MAQSLQGPQALGVFGIESLGIEGFKLRFFFLLTEA